MNILIPALSIGGIGLVFGVILAVASKIFHVDTDPRLEQIQEALPGANCGGCGFAGCASFAQNVLDGKAKVNGCPVGGADSAAKIAEIMGVAAPGEEEKQSAVVFCYGGCTTDKYEYNGLHDCIAAARLGGGPKACGYGCIGFGSCENVCQFGAISVQNGVAVVNPEKCTACGRCVEICPKGIISLVPASRRFDVLCSSADKGAVTRSVCDTGCIGCRICEKKCEFGAITIENNNATIDYTKCTHCGKCFEACPRKIIYDRFPTVQ